MMTAKGIYHNGIVTLKEPLAIPEPSEVIVSFPDKAKEKTRNKFDPHSASLKAARVLLSNLKTSLSDENIEERRLQR